jgi:hypothetical protein
MFYVCLLLRSRPSNLCFSFVSDNSTSYTSPSFIESTSSVNVAVFGSGNNALLTVTETRNAVVSGLCMLVVSGRFRAVMKCQK